MLKKLSRDAQKIVDLAETLSPQNKASVVAHLAGELAKFARNATLKTIAKMATELASSVQSLKISRYFRFVDGQKALRGTITVQGDKLTTLLLEGAFSKSREEQRVCAEKIGYRFATREESREYVNSLLEKNRGLKMNDGEQSAFATYKAIPVWDEKGSLRVKERPRHREGYMILDASEWPANGHRICADNRNDPYCSEVMFLKGLYRDLRPEDEDMLKGALSDEYLKGRTCYGVLLVRVPVDSR